MLLVDFLCCKWLKVVGFGVGVIVLVVCVDFGVKEFNVVGMKIEYFLFVMFNLNDGLIRLLLNENVFGLFVKVVEVM